MNSAKRYLGIALSFALCMAVFATFAPRVAHAVTATLVQVVNTFANPVAVTNADNRGRNVVRLTYFGSIPGGTSYVDHIPLEDVSTGTVYSVPTGKRLVVDGVSFFGYPPAGTNLTAYLYNADTIPGGTFTTIPLQRAAGFSGGVWQGSTNVPDYVDPTHHYYVSAFLDVIDNNIVPFNVQVVAHLVDCTNGGGC